VNVTALPPALTSTAQPAPTFRRGREGLFVLDDRLTPGPIDQALALQTAQGRSLLWLPGDGVADIGEAHGTSPVLLNRPGDVFERLVRSGVSGAFNSAAATLPLAS
jgi:hypothetical protein